MNPRGRAYKPKTKEEILEEAHAQFRRIVSAVRDEREQCLEDRRFYAVAGSQWEGSLEAQYANKPRLEVNKVHLSLMRIFSEYRNNRISVDFVPRDGVDDDGLADKVDLLYRATEQSCSSQEALDNAFEEAAAGGFGAWRLCTEYENEDDDDDERQKIVLEPIFDADSCVFFDLGAKKKDKSDATHCFVLHPMTRESYVEEYGEDPSTWPQDITRQEYDWSRGDVYYVAEYYCAERVPHVVVVFEGLDGEELRHSQEELDEDEELGPRLGALGYREVRRKKTVRRRVRKLILSATSVLEDCGYIAGPNIPIVPVYGKRVVVDGIERCIGHVRLCKDVQRLKNMQVSKLAEISALGSTPKPIFTPEQIAGHQLMWAEDNIKNYPYLLVNQTLSPDGTPMPPGAAGYTQPAQIPPALGALLQLTDMDMRDLLGSQEQGEELNPNISGKAVELIQGRLDMQTFIYMSNMATAVKRCGEIWLGMAREVYIEPLRKLRGTSRDGTSEVIEIMRPMVVDGVIRTEADMSKAIFDVGVTVGPSSDTRRQATVRTITGMMQMAGNDPETLQVLLAAALMNVTGEGIDDVRKFFRKKLVRLGAVTPTEKESQELAKEQEAAAQKPDPQAEYLKAAASQAVSEGAQAQAGTVLKMAQAEKAKADAAKTLEEISTEKQKQAKAEFELMGEAAKLPMGGTLPPSMPPAPLRLATPPTEGGIP